MPLAFQSNQEKLLIRKTYSFELIQLKIWKSSSKLTTSNPRKYLSDVQITKFIGIRCFRLFIWPKIICIITITYCSHIYLFCKIQVKYNSIKVLASFTHFHSIGFWWTIRRIVFVIGGAPEINKYVKNKSENQENFKFHVYMV